MPRTLALATTLLAPLLLAGCPTRPDNEGFCADLLEDEPSCMDEAALEACEEVAASCVSIAVLESCPLQFACAD